MEAKGISSDRALLIHVLEEAFGTQAVCGFAPAFTCRTGDAVLYRDGRICVPDDRESVLIRLAALGLCDWPCLPEVPQDYAIAYPSEPHSGGSLTNLFSILSARSRLLNRALAGRRAFFIDPQLMRELLAHPPDTALDFMRVIYGKEERYQGIRINEECIAFEGFSRCRREEAPFHRILADHIIECSLSRRWIKPFTKDIRNKKYAFRMWLNEIGLIGPEYEEMRQTLLARLPGRGDRKKWLGQRKLINPEK